MTTLRAWFLRLGGLFGKERRDRELVEELESHLQMHIDDNLRAGMTPEEARRDALIKLGGIEQTKEIYRYRRGFPWLESLLQDVRFGLRMLRKNPGFTVVAILTLALGIGANTAVFSVANKVLLEPLPFPHADRVVLMQRSYPQGDVPQVSIPKFMVWREQTRTFQAVAAYDFLGPGINLTGSDRPEQVRGIHASAGYFDVFGVPFALGRAFGVEEDQPSGPHVAVISNGLWHSRFAGDPAIVGKTISLGGDPYEVVGVSGPSFTTDPPTDIWLPLQADPNSTDQSNYVLVAALERPGVTLEQAKAAMKLAAEEFRRRYPLWMFPGETATAARLRDTAVAGVRPALLILLGVVGFVLLLACVNMANLLLARATLRRREVGIRTALGAGRGRVIRQLLTESLMMALAGGAVGLLLGFGGIRALLTLYPSGVPGTGSYIPLIGEHGSAVSMDWRVLLFTLGVSVFSGVLFGLAPALVVSRSDLARTLKESAGRSGTDIRQQKARSALVVCELVLAVVLLAGAALLIRTFEALRSVNLGFDSQNVLTMQMSLAGTRFEKTAAVAEAVREAEQRVGTLPGVTAMALTCCLPSTGGPDLPFTIEGRAPANGGYNGGADWRFISPGFFDVFRIPVLRGRSFTNHDDSGAELVAIINESMAKQFWPNADPVGAQITIGHGLGPEFEESPRRIIGVVADVNDELVRGANSTLRSLIYVPVAQMPDALTALNNRLQAISWAVRMEGPPVTINTDIQRELRIATGGLPVAHVRSMDEVVGGVTAWNAFNATMFTVFAGVALFFAAIGIYGLLAYSVQQRTQEIGIRMALGAQPRDVRNMVIREALLLVLIGIMVGVLAALGLTRVMAGLLYGVKPWDPVAFASAIALLSAVALLAAYVPAHRATRVDPMVALRYE
jgi:predicted permease